MRIRAGTRGSRLARVQTGEVVRRLEARGHEVETVIVRTSGDRKRDVPFAQVGPAGVFVVELERALLERRIDLAVHSYKDLPSESPAGLMVAAVAERLDPADILLFRAEGTEGGDREAGGRREGEGVREPRPSGAIDLMLPLARGARVGTASARRQAWLRAMRPDLCIELLRGNLPTRLRKLAQHHFDAILLAAAGLERLERAAGRDAAAHRVGEAERGDQGGGARKAIGARETVETPAPPLPLDGIRRMRLDPARFVPAPSQGAIAIQVRAGDRGLREAVAAVDDAATHRALIAERELLRLVEGGCSLPFGAWCREEEGCEETPSDGTRGRGESRAGTTEDPAHRTGGGGAGGSMLSMTAMLGAGTDILRFEARGRDPIQLARRIWRDLRGPVEAMR